MVRTSTQIQVAQNLLEPLCYRGNNAYRITLHETLRNKVLQGGSVGVNQQVSLSSFALLTFLCCESNHKLLHASRLAWHSGARGDAGQASLIPWVGAHEGLGMRP